jgi:acylphosphatase
MHKTIVLTIRGRVQGVGFRRFVWRKAQDFGVSGWVRNLPDGSVETLIQGSEEEIRQMRSWCERGPFGSNVTGIEEKIIEQAAAYTTFEILR